ncbi:Protein F54E12.2, partial [Aphelenchoides avenae]
VDLKPRFVEEVKVVMKGVEAEVYQKMKEAVRLRVKTLLQDDYEDAGLSLRRKKKNPTDQVRNPFKTGARAITGDNFQSMSCILVLLLRLRQAAVHMSLTAQDIDMDAFRNDGDFEADALEKSLANLSLHANLREMVEENADISDEARMQQIQAIFQPGYLSAKVCAMLERVDDILKKGEKCVIVSQWSTMLDVMESHLRQQCVRLTSITGKVPTKDRATRSKKNKLTMKDLKFLFELDPPAARTTRTKPSSSHEKQQPPAREAVVPRATDDIIMLD